MLLILLGNVHRDDVVFGSFMDSVFSRNNSWLGLKTKMGEPGNTEIELCCIETMGIIVAIMLRVIIRKGENTAFYFYI